jgi:hypothetical protein
VKRTGKFLTREQFDRVQGLAETASGTPVIAFSSRHALERGGLSGEAWKLVHDEINRCAAAAGLPDIAGEYGLDLDREILSP